jgi:hypothetical protein
MRRKRHSEFHEPSLVPLADMLTNTVGIMVFILIFTVLTAGGVVLVKRLPVESSTQSQPLQFLCANGRIIPLDVADASNKFLQPLGKPRSYYEIDSWEQKFDSQRIETDNFIVTGEIEIYKFDSIYYKSASVLYAYLDFEPKQGKGDTIEDLKKPDSSFRKYLEAHDSQKNFVHFLVRPDSLDLYLAARTLAIEKLGYQTGWTTKGQDTPIRFSLAGGGREATVQP